MLNNGPDFRGGGNIDADLEFAGFLATGPPFALRAQASDDVLRDEPTFLSFSNKEPREISTRFTMTAERPCA